MNKQPTRRSSLFLMELIIAILFFSLAATVCVRFFVKSYTLEQESQKLNHAVNAATSVAEIFRNQEHILMENPAITLIGFTMIRPGHSVVLPMLHIQLCCKQQKLTPLSLVTL